MNTKNWLYSKFPYESFSEVKFESKICLDFKKFEVNFSKFLVNFKKFRWWVTSIKFLTHRLPL